MLGICHVWEKGERGTAEEETWLAHTTYLLESTHRTLPSASVNPGTSPGGKDCHHPQIIKEENKDRESKQLGPALESQEGAESEFILQNNLLFDHVLCSI